MSISSNPPLGDGVKDYYRKSLITIEEINDGSKPERKVLENGSERFEGMELAVLRLSIYAEGKFLCHLAQNPMGNHHALTYTCTFANGVEVLLPVPVAGQEPFQFFFDRSYHQLFLLDEDRRKEKSDTLYCLVLDSSGAVTLAHGSLQREKSWPLEYQLEMFRPSGKIHENCRQTIPGMDGSIEAEFDDYKIYMDTNRVLGRGKARGVVNGDNIGCDVDRGIAVLADGLGAHAQDHLASAFAVRKILQSGQHLGYAVSQASSQLDGAFNHYLKQDRYRVNIGAESQTGDTTVLAVELIGSQLYLVNIGDGRWFHIRGGEIIAQNWRKGSYRGRLIEKGILSERDSYELQKTDRRLGMIVASTLLHYEAGPDCDGPETAILQMQPGDIFWAGTDGFDAVAERDILRLLKDDPDVFIFSEEMKRLAITRNVVGNYTQPLGDGTEVEEVPAPRDNGSFLFIQKVR